LHFKVHLSVLSCTSKYICRFYLALQSTSVGSSIISNMSLSIFNSPHFDDYFVDASSKRHARNLSQVATPPCDIYETKQGYTIQVEFPGFKKEDIHIDTENNVLNVSGELKQEPVSKGCKWHKQERLFGSYKRAFALPEGVVTDDIAAQYENGVLCISIPKPKPAEPEKRRIAIS